MTHRYFYINDLQLIGKKIRNACYLYKNHTWEDDTQHIIDDRLTGYCHILKTTGNPHMLVKIEEISYEDAKRLLHLF
ncbi:MAG: hypothetical protein FD133_606 [Erysipelotrichaceae bacterium]|nr:MAG: hypothetical protein FD179_1807 [Erysipelotrichaceae bacterium]TXT18852.1 MAG: hypothetical protein FD133_606 [Erysipelotrichaceae bacterium]